MSHNKTSSQDHQPDSSGVIRPIKPIGSFRESYALFVDGKIRATAENKAMLERLMPESKYDERPINGNQ